MRHPLGHSPLDWIESICERAHVMGVSFSFGLSWDDVCPCVGCAPDFGLSCYDVWSLVYSSGLSWDELRWSLSLYSYGLSWVGLRWFSRWYSCGLSWVDLLRGTSLWLSTGGRVTNGWALVDVWDSCYIVLRVRFTCNPNLWCKGYKSAPSYER